MYRFLNSSNVKMENVWVNGQDVIGLDILIVGMVQTNEGVAACNPR